MSFKQPTQALILVTYILWVYTMGEEHAVKSLMVTVEVKYHERIREGVGGLNRQGC